MIPKKPVLKVSKQQLQQTLSHLQTAGELNKECVVLWLGVLNGNSENVKTVIRPEHEAEEDWFNIPDSSLKELSQLLQSKGLMVLAQVHSHPETAFHSWADDRMALVRRKGALSVVIPYFGKTTNTENFFDNSATFSLVEREKWNEIEHSDLIHRVEVY